ncbi:uncharacterized protein LOC105435817 [Cucumis sativus]|uniref:DUF4408 domain-containing protein n=1 Tax=Cucumis sativus TaxID=3659 RepID=A0A0A0LUF0_CUCSA|nr:uncharacterized protein LOC105435817 [Cucumis sativus]KGN65525.1 hypothetical protein Csa_020076 [Cucumis sativus]
MITEFSAPKSVVMNIKLPKKFLYLFAKGALFLISFFFIYFSLSSDLFNHTNFWFFLSNTLIFVIALDSGAFSSPSSFVPAAKPNPSSPQHNFNNTIVVNQLPNSPIPAQNEEEETIIPLTTEISFPCKFNNPIKPYQRSKSEKDIKRMVEKAKKVRMRRSKTMIKQNGTSTKEKEEENDEFTKMTDEELNRRVEEFIERFNRQIRLQEMNEDENEKEDRF